MENLLTEFQDSIHRLGITKNDRILLAVSGGMDSVVMTECCMMAGLDFGIAHANFQLRGSESERDEMFVRQLALKYNKTFFTKKFDTKKFAALEKCSIQVAARKLRYEWFSALMGIDKELFQLLFTAHHLDDNIETMLMHFFRGTGIAGLTGIPQKNGEIIRPFLKISRSRLKEFAISQNLDWVEDSSNASDDYTRNYFRNNLIPSLTNIFPEIHNNLENNLMRFSEASVLFHQAVSLHKKKLLKQNGSEIHIPILLLKKSVPLQTIIYEIIKEYGFSPAQTEELIKLMDSSNGKYISSSSHRIIKNRDWLIIAPLEETNNAHIIVDQNTSTVFYPQGKLQFSNFSTKESGSFSKDPANAFLDAGKIQFPLILRKWKTGD
ncbi:MAG TPA: tRNA lysidine(34) synthetase TilS, partial [Puia sp.]|nr:tRNA lysidine(34) synthetase TilS [Puia sp.]